MRSVRRHFPINKSEWRREMRSGRRHFPISLNRRQRVRKALFLLVLQDSGVRGSFFQEADFGAGDSGGQQCQSSGIFSAGDF